MSEDSVSPTSDWSLAVDIGGTFTDLVLLDAACGTVVVDKTLTTPSRPARRRCAAASPRCSRRPACSRATSRRRSCTPRR